jgi:hypothetical protein
VTALKDKEPDVRETAAWALGQIESATAIDGLKGALTDQSPDVQQTAAWALAQIDDDRARTAVSQWGPFARNRGPHPRIAFEGMPFPMPMPMPMPEPNAGAYHVRVHPHPHPHPHVHVRTNVHVSSDVR